jgi:hypothetical protein
MNALVIERGRIPDQLNSIDFASSTDLATPAIPPAFRMCSINAFCCSVAFPLAVLTSIAANTGRSITHHLWGDRDLPVANQVTSARAANAKLHISTSSRVRQTAAVISPQPYRAATTRQSDLLLDAGFAQKCRDAIIFLAHGTGYL